MEQFFFFELLRGNRRADDPFLTHWQACLAILPLLLIGKVSGNQGKMVVCSTLFFLSIVLSFFLRLDHGRVFFLRSVSQRKEERYVRTLVKTLDGYFPPTGFLPPLPFGGQCWPVVSLEWIEVHQFHPDHTRTRIPGSQGPGVITVNMSSCFMILFSSLSCENYRNEAKINIKVKLTFTPQCRTASWGKRDCVSYYKTTVEKKVKQKNYLKMIFHSKAFLWFFWRNERENQGKPSLSLLSNKCKRWSNSLGCILSSSEVIQHFYPCLYIANPAYSPSFLIIIIAELNMEQFFFFWIATRKPKSWRSLFDSLASMPCYPTLTSDR